MLSTSPRERHTLSGRLTPPTIAVLLPEALAFAKSASCLDSSAFRSKKEVALIPFALDLLLCDISDGEVLEQERPEQPAPPRRVAQELSHVRCLTPVYVHESKVLLPMNSKPTLAILITCTEQIQLCVIDNRFRKTVNTIEQKSC